MSGLDDAFFLVTASAAGEGGVQIEESIEIDVAGSPADAIFQATPTSIPQTGGTVNLQVSVVDGNFDALPGVSVFFGTDLGSLASQGLAVQTNANGAASDTLTANESELTAFGGTAFTVRVQAGGVGGVVIERSATIRIQTGVPRASFNHEGVPGSPMQFQFTSTSTGQAPLTCAWNFGDGNGTTQSCTQTVPHTYGGNGTFTVTLTVTNSLGTDNVSIPVTVPHDE
jgi:PKD repeat protein